MREFSVKAERIDEVRKCSTDSNIIALKLAIVMHSTHKHTLKTYKSHTLTWGLHSDVKGDKKVIQPCVKGSWNLFALSVIMYTLLTMNWAGPRWSANKTVKVGEYRVKQLKGTQKTTYISICWHWVQWRQQLCTRATEAEQKSRTVSLLKL